MKSPKNKFKVGKKVWRKWSLLARTVFNRVYEFVYDNPEMMLHPKQEKPKPIFWKTTAWNAAWIAADAVDDTIPDEIVEV